MAILRFLVLTDIHAYSIEKGQAPSWLSTAGDESNEKQHPISGLLRLIRTDNIAADYVICCGDMADKADPSGQKYIWSKLHSVVQALGAKSLLVTPGNHDVDSRYINASDDPNVQLKSLVPPFPVTDDALRNKFWAQHYFITECDGLRILNVNSAAFHGGGKNAKKEFEHGRVSEKTIDAIVSELNGEWRSANLLLCHHHPFKNDLVRRADYSAMMGGDQLLNALAVAKVGSWLVVHGHRHMPRLQYGPGGNEAPVIFSAGSLGARLYPEYHGTARNEVYLLELHIPDEPQTSLRGIVKTWKWAFGDGWDRAFGPGGMPYQCGFGARVDLSATAKVLAEQVEKDGYLEWDDATKMINDLIFLLPEDEDLLIENLTKRHAIRVFRDENYKPAQLGKRK